MILVGVVAVMLLTGKTFNFVAIVGTLGLIGMLIKNGIVLMDEITLQLNQGIEPLTPCNHGSADYHSGHDTAAARCHVRFSGRIHYGRTDIRNTDNAPVHPYPIRIILSH